MEAVMTYFNAAQLWHLPGGIGENHGNRIVIALYENYRLEPSVKSQVVAVEPTYLFAFCIICDGIITYHMLWYVSCFPL